MTLESSSLNECFVFFRVVLLGETNISAEQVNFEQIARDVCRQVGYTGEEIGLDCANCQVITNIHA